MCTAAEVPARTGLLCCNALEISTVWTSCSLEKWFLLLFVLDCAPGLAQQQAPWQVGSTGSTCSVPPTAPVLASAEVCRLEGWGVACSSRLSALGMLPSPQQGSRSALNCCHTWQRFSGVTWERWHLSFIPQDALNCLCGCSGRAVHVGT